jgi:hypothetical protein
MSFFVHLVLLCFWGCIPDSAFSCRGIKVSASVSHSNQSFEGKRMKNALDMIHCAEVMFGAFYFFK